MVAIPYRFDPGHRHHENRFLYQEPVLFISVLILFCLCFSTKSIGDAYLCLKATSDELKRPSEPSEPAERKTNRLKRKDLRSTCVSKSQVIQLQKGYAVIVARAIMMIWTCAERFAGAPIDYGQAAHINIVP